MKWWAATAMGGVLSGVGNTARPGHQHEVKVGWCVKVRCYAAASDSDVEREQGLQPVHPRRCTHAVQISACMRARARTHTHAYTYAYTHAETNTRVMRIRGGGSLLAHGHHRGRLGLDAIIDAHRHFDGHKRPCAGARHSVAQHPMDGAGKPSSTRLACVIAKHRASRSSRLK